MLVSIITPVYNSEKHLIDCLNSVKLQTYQNWEHLLVDDCSNDNSFAIIQDFLKKDDRIKYIKLKKNSGAGVARNMAIRKSKGEFIAFLDSDDLWSQEKLSKQVSFMIKNNYHFSFTSYNKIDEQGHVISSAKDIKKKITYKFALYKNPIGCLTVIYSTIYFGKQYMPSIRKRQDYALWLKLLKKTNAYGLNENLASYRDSSGSISSNKLDLIKYEWKIYRDIEGLSFFKSLFYLTSAVFIKLKSYF